MEGVGPEKAHPSDLCLLEAATGQRDTTGQESENQRDLVIEPGIQIPSLTPTLPLETQPLPHHLAASLLFPFP